MKKLKAEFDVEYCKKIHNEEWAEATREYISEEQRAEALDYEILDVKPRAVLTKDEKNDLALEVKYTISEIKNAKAGLFSRYSKEYIQTKKVEAYLQIHSYKLLNKAFKKVIGRKSPNLNKSIGLFKNLIKLIKDEEDQRNFFWVNPKR
jgi:hypothetical protein